MIRGSWDEILVVLECLTLAIVIQYYHCCCCFVIIVSFWKECVLNLGYVCVGYCFWIA